MNTPVADAHVDVLWRMERGDGEFYGDSPLQAAWEKLRTGGVKSQVFALFTSPIAPGNQQLYNVLAQIDLFFAKVASPKRVRFIGDRQDYQLAVRGDEIAGFLSLEGAGCLLGQTSVLRMLFKLGVRGVGLTWNRANELADGCLEPRQAGLTQAGRDVVMEMQRLGMWIDIAHLAQAGVRDIFHLTDGVVMASHANARSVHSHPRNLPDDVIRELIRRGGWMGLTFEASFLSDRGASIDDAFRHLDHVLNLGGEDLVGLGSDFDGTSHAVSGLSDAADYKNFAEQLVHRYGRQLAAKVLYQNFDRFVQRVLPDP
ncbi:dipeptidase [Alicyclobacillus tolerans]|uniref:dipeptidase n=1 Tax=Alicyclobacillus tolerans TaxID=90970 RepID=UPI001F3CF4EC|nr:dipeptidase [Alicyclobacillus tolerans]MCF8564833.1 dipeptidase [Alicyclobacillus tolerans]